MRTLHFKQFLDGGRLLEEQSVASVKTNLQVMSELKRPTHGRETGNELFKGSVRMVGERSVGL